MEPADLNLNQPEEQAKQQRAVDVEQLFVLRCECGRNGTVRLRHYELVRCECGLVYWALRPKRNGAMKLFPWPGDYKQ
jgi:hypothetical protein